MHRAVDDNATLPNACLEPWNSSAEGRLGSPVQGPLPPPPPQLFVMEVLDTTLPLQQRIRALHVIKDSIPKCDAAEQEKHLQLLIDAFPTTDSVLFKHEIAFTLGQIGDRRALPHLTRWLHDANEDPVTRHECAEAMGAIGDPSSVPELEKYRDQGPVELQETVHLALRRLEWLQKGGQQEVGEFMSVDPAPPATAGQSIAELQAMLLNEELDMFERYRAMFALRNLSTEESVLALCAGLRAPKSALFRHEIAYVLGQLEHPASVPALQVPSTLRPCACVMPVFVGARCTL